MAGKALTLLVIDADDPIDLLGELKRNRSDLLVRHIAREIDRTARSIDHRYIFTLALDIEMDRRVLLWDVYRWLIHLLGAGGQRQDGTRKKE